MSEPDIVERLEAIVADAQAAKSRGNLLALTPEGIGYIEQAIERLRSSAPVWRDIESAPKDGTAILSATSGEQRVVSWVRGAWRRAPDAGLVRWTHWQPLPATPEGK